MKRVVSAILLVILLTSMLYSAFKIIPAEAAGTIYIRADGSIDPPTAPILQEGNVYTLTSNITSTGNGIVVLRNNMTLDGAGYTIQGSGIGIAGIGINLTVRANTRNISIINFNVGIHLNCCSSSTVHYSTIADNGMGISLFSSNNNTISWNTITNHGSDGIFLRSSDNNSITENSMTDNFRGISLDSSSNDNCISRNTITITHNGFGSWGILLVNSLSNIISGNKISNYGWEGIYLAASSSSNISGNEITSIDLGIGIHLGSSSNFNSISGNSIGNSSGILVDYSSNFNSISGNNITASTILFSNSSGNSIFHNNFINTYVPFYSNSENVWDDGYPSGGNYWSDYTLRYPGAEELGDSGIWDTPYVIDAYNQDNYPLINPWTTQLHKFRIGDWVQTTANLNVREGPGLNYTIINTMPLGTIGQVIGGPAEADGFVWWNVSYDVGVTGWSVENWLELHVSGTPACVVELQQDGVEISEVGVWEFFDIYVGDSTGDTGIKQVRFSSDNVQDGYPTGEWTDSFDWDISSEDWYAATKIKHWAFDTPGYKEVWAEVKDEAEQTAFGFATIFVPAPALPVLTSPLVITPVKDIYNMGDSLEAEFTIKNIGDVPITLDVLTVGGRLNGFIPPEGAPDFTFQPVTLQPNEPYQYQGSLTLTRRGNYNFFIAYYIENPTADQEKLLDENNWNTCVELGEGLTHNSRVKNIIVLEEGTAPEQYELLKSRIYAEKNHHLQYQYPPNLLDEKSFGNRLGKVWMSFKSFFSRNDLVGQYRQVYHAGKGYQRLAFKASTDAEQALNDYNLENARAFLNQAYRYDIMSEQSFVAAAELVDRNLESLETLVRYVAKGCELFVRYSTKIAFPAAAPLADAFYLALNFGITTKLEGETQAVKDALLDVVLQLVFFDREFISLGDNTLLEYVDRVSEFVPLDTILASEEFMQEFGIYLRVVLETRIDNLILEETVGLITHWLVSIAESASGTRKSPVDIRVFDSEGRITGLINGVVKHEIPMSLYCNGTVTIFFPSDIYSFEFVGTDEGTYGLEIASVSAGNTTVFTATDIPTSDNATHQYTADWNALSVGEEGVTVLVDVEGDGMVDRIFSSDSELTDEEFLEKTSPTYPTYALTINTNEGGTTFPPLGTYACSANSTVQVAAFPGEGYVLDYWELDSVNAGSNNPYTVPMQENHTLNASFRLGIYDIAVTSVSSSKTVVGQGCSLNMNVTVANPGDFTETFNVTVYANTTVIDTRAYITLASRNSATLTFAWNSSGFAKGNYTISAYASPVSGETDTDDNLLVEGWVFVAMPGDVNADRIVDIFDITTVALAFNSKPGDSNWNPVADINSDNIVDIFDIVVVALHFGETG